MNEIFEPLSLFHPLVSRWFRESFGEPTEIQRKAWPRIAAASHLLLIAPTGSGKTLTAFLWALNQLVSGAWPAGAIRVLYVSPLKALNTDIRLNLLKPLQGIEELFRAEGLSLPSIRVLTRSGDTPEEERRGMLRRPPEILITTPESLNLMLSSPRARLIFSSLTTVVLDEVHALASGKRGTHLFTAVERLTLLAGEFQRIGLSATVRPQKRVAALIGGFRPSGARQKSLQPREVRVIVARRPKRLELSVRFPAKEGEEFWPGLAVELNEILNRRRSTLFFVNTRRHAERVARLINDLQGGEPRVFAHHGSLSRELREVVEGRLKEGRLRGIVATSSLELGIDVGELEEVVLIQTPSSVASTLQRIGRAGHQVGQVSRGTFTPIHGLDLLEAAVMVRSVLDREIEEARPPAGPLDVLAQLIVSMTGVEEWDLEELYAFLRRTACYHDLPRGQFDLVCSMLEGRYGETRLRELAPRVSIDRISGRIRARDGALSLIYRSGGTIPDRGAFELRLKEGGAKLGELDEEFVWERRIGDSFQFGTQCWRITAIDARKVEVVPQEGPVNAFVFWKAERGGRDFAFCRRLASCLEGWNDRLGSPDLLQELGERNRLDAEAAQALTAFLQSQRRVTGSELPHRRHLLIEHPREPVDRAGLHRVFIHTLWGARVNQPLALALAALWEKDNCGRLGFAWDDACILLHLPQETSVEPLLRKLELKSLESFLREKLEGTGTFGARFRENAGRALLLPRQGFRGRVPLWLTRLRSHKLLEAISGYEDFPILLETWRSCLQEDFDLASLAQCLQELGEGRIRISELATPHASPFTAGLAWIDTNALVYMGDQPRGASASSLRGDLIREVAGSPALRPRIEGELAQLFSAKLQRLHPGYAPGGARQLLDWLKERLLIPWPEWEKLLAAAERDHGLLPEELAAELGGKALLLHPLGAAAPLVAGLENLPRLLSALKLSAETAGLRPLSPQVVLPPLPRRRRPVETEEAKTGGLSRLLAEWLRFYGPVTESFLAETLGLNRLDLEAALVEMEAEEIILRDRLLEAEAEGPQVCERENLERLLRMKRQSRRPAFRPLPADFLAPFLAAYQGLLPDGAPVPDETQDLERILEPIFGFPAEASLWEEEILPSRLPAYRTTWLEELLHGRGLLWFGCGRKKVSFCLESDHELFAGEGGEEADLEHLMPALVGRFGFWELAEHSGLRPEELTELLWKLSWQGRLSCDSFEPLRRGMATGFRVEAPAVSKRSGGGIARPRRIGFARWKASRPLAGAWFALGDRKRGSDEMDREELSRDRARVLMQRYGVLFRELLEKELPLLRWGRLFRTLRLLELSGELLSGRFFEGVSGVQFCSPEAFELLLRGNLEEPRIFWICAADPASPCGVGLADRRYPLPPRRPGTHLIFDGERPVVLSYRSGRELEIRVTPEDPLLPDFLERFSIPLNREVRPWPAVRVERINGKQAVSSPFAEALLACGFRKDYRGLVLRSAP